MQSKKNQKLILLNAGKKAREDFFSGCGDIPHLAYKTKEMIAYTEGVGQPHFYYANEEVDFHNAVIFTRVHGTDAHFCGILYYYFNHNEIPANDPINASFEEAEEKIAQMITLPLRGIRVPKTVIAREESFVANRAIIEKLMTFPAVFKTNGSRGRNVFGVENMADVEKQIQNIKKSELFIVQSFIENTHIVRILVYKDTILGAVKRAKRKDIFLNSVSADSKVEIYIPTPEEAELAIKACQVSGIDFGGIDILQTSEGPVTLEVNKSPRMERFELTHQFPVFKAIAEKMCKEYFI